MTKIEKLETFIKELWPETEVEIPEEDGDYLLLYGVFQSNNQDEVKTFPATIDIDESGKVTIYADMYEVKHGPVGPYKYDDDIVYPRQTWMINPEVQYF